MSRAVVDIPRRDEIERLIAHGVSNGAIAASLQVPHADVARVRKILREAALAEGRTPAEMAAALDVGLTTVTEIIARLEGRRSWRRQATISVQVDHRRIHARGHGQA